MRSIMHLAVVIAVVIGVCGIVGYSPDLLAQSVPGPAADGWVVLIGQNPSAVASRPDQVCMAALVTSEAADTKSWAGVGKRFEPQKKIRFASKAAAVGSLAEAGWRSSSFQGIWLASSGCTFDLAKLPPGGPSPSQPRTGQAIVTKSEIEAVRQKIRPCWNTPANDTKSPVVTLVLQMNIDGTVLKADVRDQELYAKNPLFRVTADAAHRAVMNPRCQPWPLSPDSYDSWRKMTLTFDPRDQ